MVTHGSASTREETPHENETTQITISDALRHRAQSIVDDTSIDPQWRAIIRYGLETNDPLLADLVERAAAGEKIIDTFDFSQLPEPEGESDVEKIEAMADLICRARGEPTAALFVLMGTLQNSTEPEALVNAAKHYAFTRCGELNVYGMVDAQIPMIEDELFGESTSSS